MNLANTITILAGGPGSGRTPYGRNNKNKVKFGDKELPETRDKHKDILKYVPSEHLKGIKAIVIDPDQEYKGYYNSDFDKFRYISLGRVDNAKVIAKVDGKNVDDSQFSLLHEIGHHVYSKLSDEDKSKFENGKDTGKTKVTGYKNPNKEEQFAEAYAAHLLGLNKHPETGKDISKIVSTVASMLKRGKK